MATLSISSMSILTGSRNNNSCVVPIVDTISNQNEKAKITAHNLFYSNNTTVGSLSSYNNYFGTGIDGTLTISSSAQVSSSLNNISREFGDTIVKNYQDLTINSGILFNPLRPCRGMVIYCTGNLTVNGTISMTGKGGGVVTKIASPIGIASSTDSRYDLVDATLYFNNLSSSAAGGRGIPTHWNWAPSGSAWFSNFKTRIAIISGSVGGGVGGSSPDGGGSVGSAGVFCCGGGGGGGAGEQQYGSFSSGATGGRGTIFAGGGGGGGGTGGFSGGGTGIAGQLERGGAGGGPTANGYGGGGAGTAAASPGNGSLGSGGLLILIVRGNIIINGTVSSNGSSGGTGNAIGRRAGAGGGSGGGRIVIIHGGTYTNAGSVVTNGGAGGPGPAGSGGSGGAGSITTRKVHI